MKACTKCGEVKPLAEFYKGERYRGGRRAQCKACCSTATAAARRRLAERRRVARRDSRRPYACRGCPLASAPHGHVPLAGGSVAIIDAGDIAVCDGYTWSATRRSGTTYATGHPDEGRTAVYLHRLLCPTPPGSHVDHINHDGLDNRRANLRPATPAQNGAHRRPTERNPGVRRGRSGRWVAYVATGGRQRHLGTFDTEAEAVGARNAAAAELWGEFAPSTVMETPA